MVLSSFAALAFLALGSAPDETLYLRDGRAITVASYELKESVVVFETLDGKFHSLGIDLIDAGKPQSATRRSLGIRGMLPLRFGWVPGMSARVDVAIRRLRSGTAVETPERITSGASYRLDVSAHERGLLLTSSEFEYPALPWPSGSSELGLQPAMLQRAAATTPNYVVGLDGTIVTVSELARLDADVDESSASLIGSVDNVEISTLLDQLLSGRQLAASIESGWNELAGFWLDAALEIGEVYELEVEAPFALVPGLVVPMRLEFSASSRVDCPSRAAGRLDCVELWVRSVPAEANLRDAAASFFARQSLPNGGDPPRLVGLQMETSAVLIAEPDTLVPHSLETTKRVTVSGDVPGGGAFDVEQVDERLTRFDWRPEAP